MGHVHAYFWQNSCRFSHQRFSKTFEKTVKLCRSAWRKSRQTRTEFSNENRKVLETHGNHHHPGTAVSSWSIKRGNGARINNWYVKGNETLSQNDLFFILISALMLLLPAWICIFSRVWGDLDQRSCILECNGRKHNFPDKIFTPHISHLHEVLINLCLSTARGELTLTECEHNPQLSS